MLTKRGTSNHRMENLEYIVDYEIRANGLPKWLSSKEPPAGTGDTGDVSSIPGSEDPLEDGNSQGFSPGESHGQSTIIGVAESDAT